MADENHVRELAYAMEAHIGGSPGDFTIARQFLPAHLNDLRALLSERRKMVEALEPFVSAFEAARERYIRRYRDNAEIGAANFDKMPDEWPMDLPVPFRMGQYRKARAALTGSETNAR